MIAFATVARLLVAAVVVALVLTGREAEVAFGAACAIAAALVRLSGAA